MWNLLTNIAIAIPAAVVLAIAFIWGMNKLSRSFKIRWLRNEGRLIEWEEAVRRVRANEGRFTAIRGHSDLYYVTFADVEACKAQYSPASMQDKPKDVPQDIWDFFYQRNVPLELDGFLWDICHEEHGSLVMNRPKNSIEESLELVDLSKCLIEAHVFLWTQLDTEPQVAC